MHRFFIDQSTEVDASVIISGNDYNHLKNSLRLNIGDRVILSDGDGFDMEAEIIDFNENEAELKVLTKEKSKVEAELRVWLAQGLPKKSKMDLIVEKATEIKGAVKEPGVYYFFEELRVIDLIQMAGGFTNLADYSEINLSAFVKDTDVFRVPEIENELTIAIDLKGQVKYPGVYYMKEGARIIDLVRLAGGFRPDADTSEINLSELLEDEDIVKVNKIDNDQNYIYVEIKGEVFLPGIYALRPGTRLIMLLNRAGGLTIFANDSELNRTRELVDGEIIVIPSIEEEDEEEEEEEEEENIPVEESYYIKITGAVFDPGIYLLTEGLTMMDVINSAGGLTIEADLSQIDFSFLVSENASIHIISTNELTTEIPDVSEERLNINIASVDELQSLSGIGIILAERIIEYRESNGPFDSIEAIMDVSGIGESIYDQIKDDITV